MLHQTVLYVAREQGTEHRQALLALQSGAGGRAGDSGPVTVTILPFSKFPAWSSIMAHYLQRAYIKAPAPDFLKHPEKAQEWQTPGQAVEMER